HGALVADIDVDTAARWAAGLVRFEVLDTVEPPRFLHPIIHAAVEASLGSDQRAAAHRVAASVLFEDRAQPGQVASHLVRLPPSGDPWVVLRLREAADAAMTAG